MTGGPRGLQSGVAPEIPGPKTITVIIVIAIIAITLITAAMNVA